MSDRHHVILRAKERYGIDLTRLDIDAMAKTIQAGRAVLLGRPTRSHPVERHLVPTRHGVLVALYDPRIKAVVTVERRGTRTLAYRDPKGRRARRKRHLKSQSRSRRTRDENGTSVRRV